MSSDSANADVLVQRYTSADVAFTRQEFRPVVWGVIVAAIYGLLAVCFPFAATDLLWVFGGLYGLILVVALLNKGSTKLTFDEHLPLTLAIQLREQTVHLSSPKKSGSFRFNQCRWYRDHSTNAGKLGRCLHRRYVIVFQVEELLIPCCDDAESQRHWSEQLTQARCPRLPHDPTWTWGFILLFLALLVAAISGTIGAGIGKLFSGGPLQDRLVGTFGFVGALSGFLGALLAMTWDRVLLRREGWSKLSIGGAKFSLFVIVSGWMTGLHPIEFATLWIVAAIPIALGLLRGYHRPMSVDPITRQPILDAFQ